MTLSIENCEELISQWNGYADNYATIDVEKALRFRRLASQMQGLLANPTNMAEIRTINVRQPMAKVKDMAKVRRARKRDGKAT